MLARAGRTTLADQFYTYKDLASLWRVKPQTVRVWFMQLRRQGKGPERGQAFVTQRHAAMRITLVRSDYALFVQRLKVEPMK